MANTSFGINGWTYTNIEVGGKSYWVRMAYLNNNEAIMYWANRDGRPFGPSRTVTPASTGKTAQAIYAVAKVAMGIGEN